MSFDVDEATLKEFMRKHYPKYAENMALARILYAKAVGQMAKGLPKLTTLRVSGYKGMRVIVEGVLAGVRAQTYLACPRCRRAKKNCACATKDDAVVERKIVTYTIADNYGSVQAVSWEDEPQFTENDIGKEVEVVGVVDFDESSELYKLVNAELTEIVKAKQEEPKEADGLAEVLTFVKDAGRVKREVVLKYAKQVGADLEKLFARLVIDGDYVMVKE